MNVLCVAKVSFTVEDKKVDDLMYETQTNTQVLSDTEKRLRKVSLPVERVALLCSRDTSNVVR